MPSSCVTVPTRLDPVSNRGIVDPKFKLRGPYANGLSSTHCDCKEGHIGAVQIFPLLTYAGWTTPTVKHHCPRTAAAAALRACSNRVSPDPKMFADYSEWFRTDFSPWVLGGLDQEDVVVDFETWLQKDGFDEQYRTKMRRAADPEYLTHNVNGEYDAFAKIEMQFTEVPDCEKETPANEVKERQICGPKDGKKFYGNPFIWYLEGVAHKHLKEYCGRKNWVDICKDVDEATADIENIIFGSADGSAFDTTQTAAHNANLHELLTKSANHVNVTFNEPLTRERMVEALNCSLYLDVSVDHGKLKYKAEGRASGDGWTTYGNTLLMLSYWKYVFKLAGIHRYFLRVKGDDVIFAFNKRYMDSFLAAVSLVFTEGKHEHSHGLGQICKKVMFGDLTDIDFLSNDWFVNDAKGAEPEACRFTRKLARVFQTTSLSTKMLKGLSMEQVLLYQSLLNKTSRSHVEEALVAKYNTLFEDRARQLAYSKGMSLMWGEDLPIIRKLKDALIRVGKPGKWSEFDQYADAVRVWNSKRETSVGFRMYLEAKHGIGPKQIEAIEAKLDTIQDIYGVVDIPELSLMF